MARDSGRARFVANAWKLHSANTCPASRLHIKRRRSCAHLVTLTPGLMHCAIGPSRRTRTTWRALTRNGVRVVSTLTRNRPWRAGNGVWRVGVTRVRLRHKRLTNRQLSPILLNPGEDGSRQPATGRFRNRAPSSCHDRVGRVDHPCPPARPTRPWHEDSAACRPRTGLRGRAVSWGIPWSIMAVTRTTVSRS